jgi:hypothetical protein
MATMTERTFQINLFKRGKNCALQPCLCRKSFKHSALFLTHFVSCLLYGKRVDVVLWWRRGVEILKCFSLIVLSKFLSQSYRYGIWWRQDYWFIQYMIPDTSFRKCTRIRNGHTKNFWNGFEKKMQSSKTSGRLWDQDSILFIWNRGLIHQGGAAGVLTAVCESQE